MASDTLESIMDYVRIKADLPDDDPKFTPSKLTTIVNMALRQVSTDQDPWWLRTSASMSIVAGTTSYPTSAYPRFVKLARIVDADGFDLDGVAPRDVQDYIRHTSDVLYVYAVQGNDIIVGPEPTASATFTIHYYQYEPTLAAESDQPLLPVQYTDYLVSAAGVIAAVKNHDMETANMLRAEVRDWRQRIRDDVRAMRAAPRIRVRPEWSRSR